MNAEIELKLFFLPNLLESLKNNLNSLAGALPQGERRLANGYFDTPKLQLRQWDMGLRVRGYDDHKEQTIKTAGQVVGGIHSRPEYNVTIQRDFPDLSLFPEAIWPKDVDLPAVQAELQCVFHTDFYRQTWHVEVAGSVVEVALDRGEIRANGQQEPLCELEFELLSGDTSALLILATEVANAIPVRLGKASKAQRGYRLAGQAKPLTLKPLGLLFPAGDTSEPLSSYCQILLETAIERWQLLEAMLLETEDFETQTVNTELALWERLGACVRLLRMTLAQFDLLSTQLEGLFNQIEPQLNLIAEAQLTAVAPRVRLTSLWQQLAYGQLQLAMVDMLLAIASGKVILSNNIDLKALVECAQEV